MRKNCQSCGNTMYSNKDMGLNKDGSVNHDFCSGCFRFGKFTKETEDKRA